jgi:hypothetical protein
MGNDVHKRIQLVIVDARGGEFNGEYPQIFVVHLTPLRKNPHRLLAALAM